MKWLMDEQVQLIGSNWFTTAQGQEMADMVETGTLDLSYLEHRARSPCREVNDAISGPQGPRRRLQQLRRGALKTDMGSSRHVVRMNAAARRPVQRRRTCHVGSAALVTLLRPAAAQRLVQRHEVGCARQPRVDQLLLRAVEDALRSRATSR